MLCVCWYPQSYSTSTQHYIYCVIHVLHHYSTAIRHYILCVVHILYHDSITPQHYILCVIHVLHHYSTAIRHYILCVCSPPYSLSCPSPQHYILCVIHVLHHYSTAIRHYILCVVHILYHNSTTPQHYILCVIHVLHHYSTAIQHYILCVVHILYHDSTTPHHYILCVIHVLHHYSTAIQHYILCVVPVVYYYITTTQHYILCCSYRALWRHRYTALHIVLFLSPIMTSQLHSTTYRVVLVLHYDDTATQHYILCCSCPPLWRHSYTALHIVLFLSCIMTSSLHSTTYCVVLIPHYDVTATQHYILCCSYPPLWRHSYTALHIVLFLSSIMTTQLHITTYCVVLVVHYDVTATQHYILCCSYPPLWRHRCTASHVYLWSSVELQMGFRDVAFLPSRASFYTTLWWRWRPQDRHMS